MTMQSTVVNSKEVKENLFWTKYVSVTWEHGFRVPQIACCDRNGFMKLSSYREKKVINQGNFQVYGWKHHIGDHSKVGASLL